MHCFSVSPSGRFKVHSTLQKSILLCCLGFPLASLRGCRGHPKRMRPTPLQVHAVLWSKQLYSADLLTKQSALPVRAPRTCHFQWARLGRLPRNKPQTWQEENTESRRAGQRGQHVHAEIAVRTGDLLSIRPACIGTDGASLWPNRGARGSNLHVHS